MSTFLAQVGGTFWMPDQASTKAAGVDNVFYFIFWVSLIFFVLIAVLMFTFVGLYRRKRPDETARSNISHSTTLELVWSLIPTIIVVFMFWWGFKWFLDMRTPPQNAYDINVTAQKWKWEFEYPNGHRDEHLHVPIDTPVRLVMTSTDVIHSLFIPAFRVKRDAVPGRYSTLWFEARQAGEYPLFCAEYCGTSHSDMIAQAIVHPVGEFELWLANADPLKKLTDEQYNAYMADPDAFIKANPDIQGLLTPVATGEQIYKRKGCTQCHSTDGRVVVGPSFKEIWGKTHQFSNAEPTVVDENYVRDSILNPQAKIVKGFDGVMPTYQGRITDREITMLIAYIRSLQ